MQWFPLSMLIFGPKSCFLYRTHHLWNAITELTLVCINYVVQQSRQQALRAYCPTEYVYFGCFVFLQLDGASIIDWLFSTENLLPWRRWRWSMENWNFKTIRTSYFYIKGQLISKCPFGVIVSTKIPTKKIWQFLP